MTAQKHYLPEEFFTRQVSIHVIGCGGTGSHLVPRLPLLHKSLLALGHPAGISVTVWDGDCVSESNTVRQNFFPPDVGMNKASVMVNRINGAYGLDWVDEPRRIGAPDKNERYSSNPLRDADIVIGCVDTKSARRDIDQLVRDQYQNTYYIDSGNSASSGQIIVGQYSARSQDDPLRLPLVSELYPELLEGVDDDAPSCSARESLARQGLATNPMCAAWIMTWLSEGFRHGFVEWSGLFFNLSTGRSSSIPVDPAVWDGIRPAPTSTELPKAA